jgi:hypothetical protein
MYLTVEMLFTRCRYAAALLAVFLLSHSPLASAQTSAPLPTQQLDDLVAPIALYPDSLVAQVLAASTYPIEIAEAEQWVKDHPKWKAAKLTDKSKKEKWDPSVKALVAFPQVLTMMTESLTWTTQLRKCVSGPACRRDASSTAHAGPSRD